jgi:putative DNA methylase
MSKQLMAIVAQGRRERFYLPPMPEHEAIAASAEPSGVPETDLPLQALGFRVQLYGMTHHRDLFTQRQLAALTTFSDLVGEARRRLITDGASAEYATAVATYLGMGVSRLSDICNSLCMWENTKTQVRHLFTRQAISMLWDFAEANVFADAAGDFGVTLGNLAKAIEATPARGKGDAAQLDATAQLSAGRVFSTDPPYYDNIGYADLSDFFYVWLRRSLSSVYPELFSTLLVPKKQELVAAPERFGGDKDAAQRFFEEGSALAFGAMRRSQHPEFPLTVYYAFKQAEDDDDEDGEAGLASTGWETMLEGLMKAGFQITATWPARSELGNRMRGQGSNALASSIVLACRARQDAAPITTRKDFLVSLKKELPRALRNLQKGNIAPVDLAQAAIGPGMAVFSRYKKVLETDGTPMRVRTALSLINQGLDEVLTELESEFDPDTRWALAWFEQHQFDEGLYGEAEVLATAKALSISHLAEAGILHSRAGKVRLLRRDELPEGWDPSRTDRLTVWEVTQHLIRQLDQKGEKETANLKAKIGGMAEIARDLAYRLYTLCERKGWAEEAGYYNSLVVAWPSMASEAFELR